MQGTIKKIMSGRGFGFISVEGNDDDIFFHQSQLSGELVFEDIKEGQVVNFEIEETDKGPQAVKVTAE